MTAVNDVPSFTPGGDQTSLLEDAGAQTLTAWATAMSAGPPDEAIGQKKKKKKKNWYQMLSFSVKQHDNALFLTQPAIAPQGTLTYTAAPNAHGTAIVTVSLSDNGGVENGGMTPARADVHD